MNRLKFLGKMEARLRAQACISHVRGDWNMWNMWEMEGDPNFALLQRVKKIRQQEFTKTLKDLVRF